MTREVERVDQSDMRLSRRDLMGSSAVVAAGALGVGMVGTATAQDGPADEISGTVEDTDGNAVDGATVVAVPHDESLDALVTTTDASGNYIFETEDLHSNTNLYHVVSRDGTAEDPIRSQQNYPFIEAVGSVTIPASAVARWRFDEGSGLTAPDSIGSNDGTISGASWVSDNWQGGSALDFGGTDDLVSLDSPVAAVGDSQQFCICATVELDGTGSTQPIFAQTTEGGDNRAILSLQEGDFGVGAFDGSSRIIDAYASGTGTTNRVRVGGYFDTSSPEGRVYIDGSEAGNYSSVTFYSSGNNDQDIGANEQNGHYTDGVIDDVIVYDTLLSESEFQDDYNAQPWS